MAECEGCEQEKVGVLLRPSGRMLCGHCNMLRLREMASTGLVRRTPVPYLEASSENP